LSCKILLDKKKKKKYNLSMPENNEATTQTTERAPIYSIFNTITCHQCGGTGKDSNAKESAPCCSCFGLGKIFLKPDGIHPVDYRTQREIVTRENYLGSDRFPI
jgi:DnaJ-class molecular chaperone